MLCCKSSVLINVEGKFSLILCLRHLPIAGTNPRSATAQQVLLAAKTATTGRTTVLVYRMHVKEATSTALLQPTVIYQPSSLC